MVADELEKLGFTEINRKMLQVPGIKEVGEYIARVRLHKDVTVEVPLTIVSDTPIVKAEPKTEKAETSEEVEETTKEESAEVEQATTEE